MTEYKKGDKVLVTRKATSDEMRPLGYFWVNPMDKYVGKVLIVDNSGIDFVYCYYKDECRWNYPPFCLQKIDETFPIPKFPIKIGNETIQLPKCIIDLL